jgi:hypothetical protein
VKSLDKRRESNRFSPQPQRRDNGKVNVNCWQCNQPGHVQRECPSRTANTEQSATRQPKVSFATGPPMVMNSDTTTMMNAMARSLTPTQQMNQNSVSAEVLARRINGVCKINVRQFSAEYRS